MSGTEGRRAGASGRIAFVALMLALTGVFAVLGFWQLQRHGEKEALIATVASRMDDQPVALPPAGEWPSLDPAEFDYRPVTLTGHFETDATVLVFTSLAEPRGGQGGPGYWVMTPFATDGGGTVFVNRGFIPQQAREDLARLEPMNPASGGLTLTGIARQREEPGAFTPPADAEERIDWIRDPARLAALARVQGPVAPLYVDLPAGVPGELPQGGETVLDFPNNHLGYALTWFGFALLTPALLVFWLRRSRART